MQAEALQHRAEHAEQLSSLPLATSILCLSLTDTSVVRTSVPDMAKPASKIMCLSGHAHKHSRELLAQSYNLGSWASNTEVQNQA